MEIKQTDVRVRIGEVRDRCGLTQEELAQLLKVSRNQEQRYESAGTDIPLCKIVQIADALGVAVQDIVVIGSVQERGPHTVAYRVTPDEHALLAAYRAFKTDKLRAFALKVFKLISSEL